MNGISCIWFCAHCLDSFHRILLRRFSTFFTVSIRYLYRSIRSNWAFSFPGWKPFQLSQCLPVCHMLQSVDHLHVPSLDLPLYIFVLILAAAALQTLFQQWWAQRKAHLTPSACNGLLNAIQDAVGCLCFKGRFLAYGPGCPPALSGHQALPAKSLCSWQISLVCTAAWG